MKTLIAVVTASLIAVSAAHADYAPIGKCSQATRSCHDTFAVSGEGTNWWTPISFPHGGKTQITLSAGGRELTALHGRRPCVPSPSVFCKFRGDGVGATVGFARHTVNVLGRNATGAPVSITVAIHVSRPR
jgi:hypothetical protein